jgi:CBS domain-containing protein
MKVQDVMTPKVISCPLGSNLGVAVKLMIDGGFGTLPVIDTHGKVAGMVTDRDVAIAAATRRRNPSYIGVHEAMTPHVLSCRAGDDIGIALARMAGARVRRLPVLDDDGRLVGLLSIDDIVLRAVGMDGLSAEECVTALRAICARPAPDAGDELAETA